VTAALKVPCRTTEGGSEKVCGGNANTGAHGRIGLHQLAHLRAVAEGVPVTDVALRFLRIGHAAASVH